MSREEGYLIWTILALMMAQTASNIWFFTIFVFGAIANGVSFLCCFFKNRKKRKEARP